MTPHDLKQSGHGVPFGDNEAWKAKMMEWDLPNEEEERIKLRTI